VKTASLLVCGWAGMLLCAYALTVASLPAAGDGSFMAYVIGVYVVLPAAAAVLVVGVLLAAALHRIVRSGLWLGVLSAWASTVIVVIGLRWL
jgi:hypothetical protein